jgi:hypothetical protein
MDIDFDREILLENDRVLLRPLLSGDLYNLIDIATQEKDLLQFSPSQIYSRELLDIYRECSQR